MTKEEIKELKKCIKEKDKRIKKIEEYFWLRNRLIVSVCWSLLWALPWLLLFLYTERPPADNIIPLPIVIFSCIGVICSMIGTVAFYILGMEKIWGDW